MRRFLPVLCVAIAAVSFGVDAQAKTLGNQAAIDAFYLAREGQPYWIENGRISGQADDLIEAIEESWESGLNPESYNYSQIKEIEDTASWGGRLDGELALELELILMDAYIKYARDLSGMRVRARDLELNPKDWRQRISAEGALEVLPKSARNIDDLLDRMEPQTATYQRLKKELIRLVEEGEGLDREPLRFSGLLKPGRGDNNVPKLRARLGVPAAPQELRYTYDEPLVEAVKAFQAEKGLKPDGIIGRQTLHILNHTRMDKIRQLIANLERLRWVYDEKPDRFVVVNIPSAQLWAIENGKVRFDMPVVVGRKKRPTLSFITYIHGVRFNPTWTVPPTILEEDILPKLQEDPEYLANKGMELFDGFDKDAPTLDATVVDWNNISESEWAKFKMVQVPGAHNPLGRIRVLMPNGHNIYLHDTNDKSLFYRVNRAKSSGCVRMKDPEKIAMFALEKRKNWSEQRMRGILETGKLQDIYTPERMPVYLTYYTAWVGDNNQIVYGQDIYDYDKMLLYSLEKLDGFAILSNAEDKVVHNVDN